MSGETLLAFACAVAISITIGVHLHDVHTHRTPLAARTLRAVSVVFVIAVAFIRFSSAL